MTRFWYHSAKILSPEAMKRRQSLINQALQLQPQVPKLKNHELKFECKSCSRVLDIKEFSNYQIKILLKKYNNEIGIYPRCFTCEYYRLKKISEPKIRLRDNNKLALDKIKLGSVYKWYATDYINNKSLFIILYLKGGGYRFTVHEVSKKVQRKFKYDTPLDYLELILSKSQVADLVLGIKTIKEVKSLILNFLKCNRIRLHMSNQPKSEFPANINNKLLVLPEFHRMLLYPPPVKKPKKNK